MNLGQESEYVEFKRSTGEHREACQSIAAMLNKHGCGELYFGVRNDGEVVGQDVSDKTLRDISREIGNRLDPQVFPDIEALATEDGLTYIRVTFEGDEIPYSCDGRYRIRRADEDVLLAHAQVRQLFLENGKEAWDGAPSGRPVADVAPGIMRRLVDRGIERGRIPGPFTSDLDALGSLNLVAADGSLTNAAEVLLCDGSPYFRLTMGVCEGNDRVNILDLQQASGPVYDLIDKAERYVVANIRRRIVIDGSPMRQEIPEIPRAAIREAIINAFCHQEHWDHDRVFVDVFTDTVEISNPGLFPVGTTPDEFLAGTAKTRRLRNPLIANTLFRANIIESYGSGIKRIREACDEAGVRFEYHQEHDWTRVVFHRPGSQVELVSSANGVSANESADRAADSADSSRWISKTEGKPHGTSSGVVPKSDVEFRSCSEVVPKFAELSKAEQRVCRLIFERGSVKTAEVAELLGMTDRGARRILSALVDGGLIVPNGSTNRRVYRLKETNDGE